MNRPQHARDRRQSPLSATLTVTWGFRRFVRTPWRPVCTMGRIPSFWNDDAFHQLCGRATTDEEGVSRLDRLGRLTHQPRFLLHRRGQRRARRVCAGREGLEEAHAQQDDPVGATYLGHDGAGKRPAVKKARSSMAGAERSPNRAQPGPPLITTRRVQMAEASPAAPSDSAGRRDGVPTRRGHQRFRFWPAAPAAPRVFTLSNPRHRNRRRPCQSSPRRRAARPDLPLAHRLGVGSGRVVAADPVQYASSKLRFTWPPTRAVGTARPERGRSRRRRRGPGRPHR